MFDIRKSSHKHQGVYARHGSTRAEDDDIPTQVQKVTYKEYKYEMK